MDGPSYMISFNQSECFIWAILLFQNSFIILGPYFELTGWALNARWFRGRFLWNVGLRLALGEAVSRQHHSYHVDNWLVRHVVRIRLADPKLWVLVYTRYITSPIFNKVCHNRNITLWSSDCWLMSGYTTTDHSQLISFETSIIV